MSDLLQKILSDAELTKQLNHSIEDGKPFEIDGRHYLAILVKKPALVRIIKRRSGCVTSILL